MKENIVHFFKSFKKLTSPTFNLQLNKPESMVEYKYDIDGRLRPETNEERLAREAALARSSNRFNSSIPQPTYKSNEDRLAAAKAFIAPPPASFGQPVVSVSSNREKESGGGGKGRDSRESGRIGVVGGGSWGRAADRVLFGRDGEAPFRRGSGEFDEFVEFYVKVKTMRDHRRRYELKLKPTSVLPPCSDEEDVVTARHALTLFEEYQAKRRKSLEVKIGKDRANLPIKAYEEKIVDAFRKNRVVLVAADTGAGKSTQVPQYLLAAGFDKIACTQPRRIACYSLARRVSYESLNIYGSEIAYQVRFEGTKTSKTRILFLTEGLLLRQFAADPKLSQYNVIIVDEVHERHITGDFLLGVLKRLLDLRDDIRFVLMSATINAELFSKYFNAPVIEVPGRVYPVKIEYMPIDEPDRNLVEDRFVKERDALGVKVSIAAKGGKLKTVSPLIRKAPYLRILERIDQVVPAQERGDLLVFLSGMNEITTLAEDLRQYAGFTSSLSVKEQEKVFDVAPPGVRKCILSTNIAETSVTIDGVRFIIDSGKPGPALGKVKEMSYDSTTRLSRLSEFWISQSSAKQRAGRAGRTGPGEFPVPEILRTPLESLLLQIRAYGLGNPRTFDLIERPPDTAIDASLMRLRDLGAIDEREELSPLGRVLAIFPMDIVLGKMLILGSISDVIDATVVMAAALTIPSPFVRVPEGRSDIGENRRSLQSEYGDPLTLMNLFSEWLKIKADGRESSRNWCKRHGVEEQRLYEMVKLKTQFEEVLAEYMGRGGANRDDDDDEDSEDDQGGRRRRKRKRGLVAGDDRAEDEMEVERDTDKLKKRMFWKDPEYIRRREQKILLEQQKRMQTSGKRKILTLEDEDMETDDVEEDTADTSVHHLEFSLKHDANALLSKSDTSYLTKRDTNLIRLVYCSGLYPHIAIADEVNTYRNASEQVYHTKTKRFVKMLPTSVFAEQLELLHPTEGGGDMLPSEIPDDNTDATTRAKETLDSLRPKMVNTELLCYLELLETNKPYLTNVLRVPAGVTCLLFAHKLDISPDRQHVLVDDWLHLKFLDLDVTDKFLVMACWLRVAWDHVISRRLENVQHGLISNNLPPQPQLQVEEEPEISYTIGTRIESSNDSINDIPLREDLDERRRSREGRDQRRRVTTDWSDFDFLPDCVSRIRRDWEAGTTRCVGARASEEFEGLNEDELSRRLGDLLESNAKCHVERLRMQDVPIWFGYDPYNATTTPSHAAVRLTPNVRYFLAHPHSIRLSPKKLKRLLEFPESGPRVVDVTSNLDSKSGQGTAMEKQKEGIAGNTTDMFGGSGGSVDSVVGGENVVKGRKMMTCDACGETLSMTPVEFLKHKRSCGKEK
ncbi:DEAH (Asp-Glu-Ala-His) box polypeptide 34 [Blyttiomyces sp. JEL0837]|nr:DEAH (Asp-Glu-Ala-His) box polypeptide 34 [Blyttiomyces sp. JEL0837]